MGTQASKNRSVADSRAGGARRDRTADLLHAMQALSQLSYGPTWRRGTLPERKHFVKKMKKMNELRAPNRPPLAQSRQCLGFAQNGQRGVDGRRHRSAAHRQANRLREFA